MQKAKHNTDAFDKFMDKYSSMKPLSERTTESWVGLTPEIIWQASEANIRAELGTILAAIRQQAETIAEWLPRNGEFDVLNIDSDKVSAWVDRLVEIAEGSPDLTALQREQEDHFKTVLQYNEAVSDLAEAEELIAELMANLEEATNQLLLIARDPQSNPLITQLLAAIAKAQSWQKRGEI